MHIFDIAAALVTLAALFGWLNHRYIRLPATIGLMVISMLFSLALVGLTALGIGVEGSLQRLLLSIDFDEALLQGMLGALLFAGALHLDLGDLAEQKWVILLLATFGVLLSTLIVGGASWWLFSALGIEIAFVSCLLFGALISPTDPIAVGAILRKLGVPPALLTVITGESLFNDGVGVVSFLVILGLAGAGHGTGTGVAGSEVLALLMLEVGGGLVFGALLGWFFYQMLRSVDNYQVEILLTLAIVTGGYAFADVLHVSGPLAMVVAGLFIGNRGRALAMSELTRRRLDDFWELVDELLNAVLFVMIGLEVLVLAFSPVSVVAGLVAIPLVLGARWISVGLPVTLRRMRRPFPPHAAKVLTWSGLRGGISVALALSLPAGPERDVLLTVTYIVVAFSIIVQGLTVEKVIRRSLAPTS
jgi:CPA1 family monovalent cation:H+ antiporter